jgi:phage terminase large subunit-like protein
MIELLDQFLQFANPPVHRLTQEKLEEAVALAAEIKKREQQNRIDTFYPTPENRKAYPVHMEFFARGRQYRERLFMAANRVGKTEGAILYETVLHATGEYPEWWPGRRFAKPVECCVGGDTGTTVRDILQFKLLGKKGEFGTGLIRGSLLVGEPSAKRGISDAVETIYVKSVHGGTSTIQLKTYEQGREAWQGTSKDVVAFDEEVPEDIAGEGVMRTMDCDGMVLYGYTPLNGMTEVTQKFLDGENADIRCYVNATWDDVPHLSEAAKTELLRLTPIHLRAARSKGVPTQGVGSIYPMEIEQLHCDPFPIPKWYPRGYALDVGWNRTAALWCALDRETDTMYLYDEHYESQQEPVVHASAIKRRGKRLLGQIDPAARGRSQKDGESLLNLYRNEGLLLVPADNAVEAGLLAVWTRATEGRLRIFRGKCPNLEKEWRMYHRDKNGQVVKKNDHLLDGLRYLCNGHQHISYTTDDGNFAYTPGGTKYLTSLPSKRYGR